MRPPSFAELFNWRSFWVQLVLYAGLALWVLGCASSGPPTVTFEAEGFLTAYMADRDEVVRSTAPAVKRCRAVTPDAPVELRTRCDLLRATQAEWGRRDAVVYAALLTGKPVTTVDWEKVADVAAKFLGAAAGL